MDSPTFVKKDLGTKQENGWTMDKRCGGLSFVSGDVSDAGREE